MSAIEQIISALLNVDESPPIEAATEAADKREKAQQEQLFFYNSDYEEDEDEGDDGQDNTGGTNDGNDGL